MIYEDRGLSYLQVAGRLRRWLRFWSECDSVRRIIAVTEIRRLIYQHRRGCSVLAGWFDHTHAADVATAESALAVVLNSIHRQMRLIKYLMRRYRVSAEDLRVGRNV